MGIISMILSLSACSLNSKNKVTAPRMVRQDAKIIIEGIESGEHESILEIFSPYVKENYPNLESDIAELMKFIDGNIISYDDVYDEPVSGTSTPEGWIKRGIAGTIDNIITTTGKTYTLKFEGYFVYKDEPNKEGIDYIAIISKDTFDEEGDPETKSIYYR